MNRHLLAVSWEMPPLSGPRAVQVTRTLLALADRGWTADVVCFGPRSRRYQQDYPVAVEEQSAGAVRRRPVASPEEWFAVRALWRVCPPVKGLPDEKRVWVGRAVVAARAALDARAAGVIVSFAQPWSDHLVGLQLHQETGLPWVAHFSDPWTDSPYERGPAWRLRRAAAMERRVVEAATRVVFVNQQTAARVMAKYPETWRARARVVPQGFVAPVRSPAQPAAAPVGPLRLVYTGRFYDGVRGPEPVLAALARLDRRAPLAGRIAVDFIGQDMRRHVATAERLGLGAVVSFRNRVPPPEAQRAAAAADALLVIDAPSEGPSLFLPSKLIDYLPLGRPLLGVTPDEGPTADLLRSLGYPVAPPGDVEAIAAAIDELVAAHAAGTLGRSSRHDAVAAEYDIRETTARFERVLEEACGIS